MDTFRHVTIAAAAMLISACSQRGETLPQCFSKIQPSMRAIAMAGNRGIYKGGEIEITHALCSRNDDRLDVAERLLSANGYSSDRHIDEVGKCIDIQMKSALTGAALQRQLTTFCGIAAAARVTYRSWSANIGQRSLYVSGTYTSLTNENELPMPR